MDFETLSKAMLLDAVREDEFKRAMILAVLRHQMSYCKNVLEWDIHYGREGSPLGGAVATGVPADLVDAMLRRERVDLNAPTRFGTSWLEFARVKGASDDVVAVLIKHGARRQKSFYERWFGRATEEDACAETDVVKI